MKNKLIYITQVYFFLIIYYVGRLAWLVYLVGTVVGGRLTYTSTDEHDVMDGELSCR